MGVQVFSHFVIRRDFSFSRREAVAWNCLESSRFQSGDERKCYVMNCKCGILNLTAVPPRLADNGKAIRAQAAISSQLRRLCECSAWELSWMRLSSSQLDWLLQPEIWSEPAHRAERPETACMGLWKAEGDLKGCFLFSFFLNIFLWHFWKQKRCSEWTRSILQQLAQIFSCCSPQISIQSILNPSFVRECLQIK